MRTRVQFENARFHLTVLGFVIFALTFAWAEEKKYDARGMVLTLDPPHKTMTVSCQAIPGFMEAMAMPISVLRAEDLQGLKIGNTIRFTLVVERDSSHAEGIQVETYQGLEVDPLTARRLKLMNQATGAASTTKPVGLGEQVPDFKLIDSDRHSVSLEDLHGKVVALNFIYTRCALPDFCFRTANNFGIVQKRFKDRLGRQLVLLTITFDPAHDQPEVLRKYASVWKADPRYWHFLTGSSADIQRVCDMFGLDSFQDEGLMNHSLHTAVIDRQGRLVANIEGNQFTADQLGDLIQTVLDHP